MDVLKDPSHTLYLDITSTVNHAEACKLDKRRIAKLSKDFLVTDPFNDYAELYSYYEDKNKFEKKHTAILADRVKSCQQLSLSHKPSKFDRPISELHAGEENNRHLLATEDFEDDE